MQGVVLSNARLGSILVHLMLPVYSIQAGVILAGWGLSGLSDATCVFDPCRGGFIRSGPSDATCVSNPCRGGIIRSGPSDATCVFDPCRGGLSGLSGPSDATCGRRTQPPEGRDQPNVIPSLDQMQCNVM